ncbi:MAG: ATPase, T2SS/T4P/T4SS family [Pirellulaceae bacterium]|nr:ATPase, T2SS/T4P/T4SS family [Pirellulaceae bacterium]
MAIRSILVPVDFSKNSEVALDHACNLGRQFDAKVHLVHVIDANANDTALRKAEEQLFTTLMPSQESTLDIKRSVLRGSISEELGEYSHNHAIDLIVMGTKGRNGFSRQPLGKNVERVLTHVSRPVMVIRTDLSPDRPRLTETDENYTRSKITDIPAIDLITRASSLRATDVHIDPVSQDEYEVRFRIDGQLLSYCVMSKNVAEHLIQQLHVLARLDQAQPFKSREGRLHFPEDTTNLEVRLTSAAVAGGEAASLRIFAPDRIDLDVDKLGLSEYSHEIVSKLIGDARGLVLITGPTGSGKTTTVYSMLSAFRQRNLNIVSIEDPVEFNVPFVRQMSVDEAHGLTMTAGLKTMLRMDPDIVVIGEVRDAEAAAIAMSAANAGRLVLSSMHTRDAAATITALRDLSVDDRSLIGNLAGVINQRLVRRLCRSCRASRAPLPHEAEQFSLNGMPVPEQVFYKVGCEQCQNSGYFGRCGVFETVQFSDGLLDCISSHQSELVLRNELRRSGVPSLMCDGLSKVRDGITSLEEIQSIIWT